MKFIHLSDLHLGKRLNEFSLCEDQQHILGEIISAVDAEQPDAVIIAGDVYDKSVPPAEAVTLFDSFLNALAKRRLKVFVISGNHDSPERLSFGSKLIGSAGIFISPVYDGTVTPFVLNDCFGKVNVYMLPFVRPVNVRKALGDETLETYTAAVSAAIKNMSPDFSERNVLVTHQFVTGALRSDSEEISVGGADNVDASVFDGFDYVALGHIHRPQNISENIRYCGTPLKYSFSETGHEKSATVVELLEKGNLRIRQIPLRPKRDLRELRGTYNELALKSNYENTPLDDYLHITLTDEEEVPDALARLRTIYPNIMKLDYDNRRTRFYSEIVPSAAENRSPLELFSEFYEKQTGAPLSEEQSDYTQKLIEKIWRGE